MYIYTHIHFAVHLNLTQHCKSTIWQKFKIKKKKENENLGPGCSICNVTPQERNWGRKHSKPPSLGSPASVSHWPEASGSWRDAVQPPEEKKVEKG